MFIDLEALLSGRLPQMKLYYKIGKLVSARSEKGAAVAAAEYLSNRWTAAMYQVRSLAVTQFSKMTIFCVQPMVMASASISGVFSYVR